MLDMLISFDVHDFLFFEEQKTMHVLSKEIQSSTTTNTVNMSEINFIVYNSIWSATTNSLLYRAVYYLYVKWVVDYPKISSLKRRSKERDIETISSRDGRERCRRRYLFR